MEVLILAAVLLLSLIMIPFGMPGTLVMFAAAHIYHLIGRYLLEHLPPQP